MSFFNFLKKTDDSNRISQLQKKIQTHFPEMDENDQVLYACYAGLLSRVSYADLKITDEEIKKMEQVLSQFTDIDKNSRKVIISMAVEDMQELSGIEDHYYSRGMMEMLNQNERAQLLVALFALAAADDAVDSSEIEAIRNIATGLNLGHQHFIAAKAQVKDFLSSLKKDN